MSRSAAAGSRDTWERLRGAGLVDDLEIGDVTAAERIVGHASRRTFYRLRRAGDSTSVLVVYPRGAEEEVERYVRAQSWFRAAGLPVPRIDGRGRRALLVEDGGDRLLAGLRGEARLRAHRQAVDALVRLQTVPPGERGPNPDDALDRSRFRHELRFTEKHALRGWLGVDRGAAARERGFDRLAELAAALPTTLCHRDYHARNILVRGGRILLLDFQDVMRGPWPYDLASLLWDNYCDLEHAEVAELAHRYWRAATTVGARAGAGGTGPSIPPGLPPSARRAFCIVGLQRSLKALGTFGYQVHVAGNRDYARYAPRTWHHARRALRTLGWDDLERALAPFEEMAGG